MNIRTILFASVAALAAASGARAADAIVAAESEPVEYVRVCDAYGTGYFYIPGTETCLSIGGYIRTEVRFGDHISGDPDVDFWTRGQVTFQAKNDTEYGTLTGVITLRYNVDDASDQEALLDEGYIDIAGFRVGMLYSWWDDDMSGETDTLASNETNHNSIRYQYENGAFAAGISVDELEEDYATKPGDGPNNYGVAGGSPTRPAPSALTCLPVMTPTPAKSLSAVSSMPTSARARSALPAYGQAAPTTTTKSPNGRSQQSMP